ncbi:hypothetical protein [Paraburkholderia bryophila]|uniref:Guanylate cyclase domain-containing protein n=1 Tax=Paraburkholderia bryophila TaxID=420952 RepID=A0A7Z0B569_9BURK|nr:hypothetical protein [Paraburkholderia bryophila]NYH20092.1 hypothetical protein [Paraburkholderia bryophila]
MGNKLQAELMSELVYRPLRYRDRWFAYLDLLGFKNLIQSGDIEKVLPVYFEALKRMRAACKLGKSEVGLLNSWFSDTFIIYSRSDSLDDFAHVESAARIFFQLLLIKNIPVRGCISHGKLYSQAKQNVFLGQALIEAHEYGEALNWVGFCLAPSVEEKLKHDLPLEKRAHYRKVSDRDILRKAPAEYLYAFAFNNGTVNGENPYRKALESMKANAPPEATRKYVNSLAFLDRFA